MLGPCPVEVLFDAIWLSQHLRVQTSSQHYVAGWLAHHRYACQQALSKCMLGKCLMH